MRVWGLVEELMGNWLEVQVHVRVGVCGVCVSCGGGAIYVDILCTINDLVDSGPL